MPVLRISYPTHNFPCGQERTLMVQVINEIGRSFAHALLDWVQQDLCQGSPKISCFHLEVNWPFSGPKNLQLMVGNVGAVIANFMNFYAPEINHIEVHFRRDCLRFDKDGHLLLRRTIDGSQPGEKLFPVEFKP